MTAYIKFERRNGQDYCNGHLITRRGESIECLGEYFKTQGELAAYIAKNHPQPLPIDYPAQKEWFSVAEFCRIFKVAANTIYRDINSKNIPNQMMKYVNDKIYLNRSYYAIRQR